MFNQECVPFAPALIESMRSLGYSFEAGDSQIEEIRSRGRRNPSQKDYFKNVDRNPLLTIYMVELDQHVGADTPENRIVQENCKDEVYVGLGLGIPSLTDQETKYATYVLNKVAIQQIFEGEMIDWDTEEEEYDD